MLLGFISPNQNSQLHRSEQCMLVDHATGFQSLQWYSISYLLVHNSHVGQSAQYLSQLLKPVTDIPPLAALLSARNNDCYIPRLWWKIDERERERERERELFVMLHLTHGTSFQLTLGNGCWLHLLKDVLNRTCLPPPTVTLDREHSLTNSVIHPRSILGGILKIFSLLLLLTVLHETNVQLFVCYVCLMFRTV